MEKLIINSTIGTTLCQGIFNIAVIMATENAKYLIKAATIHRVSWLGQTRNAPNKPILALAEIIGRNLFSPNTF